MKTENLKKPLAFLMAVLMSVSCFGQSMGVAAADTGTEPDEGTDSYEESLVGDERAIEELPLSIGEIESIQSNTATFTIKLDADQDIELIEEGIDPGTGADGVSETASIKELPTSEVKIPQGGAIRALGSTLASHEGLLFRLCRVLWSQNRDQVYFRKWEVQEPSGLLYGS